MMGFEYLDAIEFKLELIKRVPFVPNNKDTFVILQELKALMESETYFVDREISELIIESSKTMPDFSLGSVFNRLNPGFVYFNVPFPSNFGLYRAFSWYPLVNEFDKLFVIWYEENHIQAEVTKNIAFWPYVDGWANWKANDGIFDTTAKYLHVENARRMASAFFAFISQDIIETNKLTATRGVIKRAVKLNMKPELSVNVVHLRNKITNKTHKNRYYDHRWIVSGHWRKQWYRKDKIHRPKYINPYIKGPSEKPIILNQTSKIYSVDR